MGMGSLSGLPTLGKIRQDSPRIGDPIGRHATRGGIDNLVPSGSAGLRSPEGKRIKDESGNTPNEMTKREKKEQEKKEKEERRRRRKDKKREKEEGRRDSLDGTADEATPQKQEEAGETEGETDSRRGSVQEIAPPPPPKGILKRSGATSTKKERLKFDSVDVIELACYVCSDEMCSDGGPAFHLGDEVVKKQRVSLERLEKTRQFQRIPSDQFGIQGRVDANTRRSYVFM